MTLNCLPRVLVLWTLGLLGLPLLGRADVGSPGNALHFPGNGAYGYTSAGLLATNRSFTVEFWARRGRSNHVENVVTLGSSLATNRFLRIGFLADDRFVFGFTGNDLISTEAYPDPQWHHWACTYSQEGNLRQIIRDGTVVVSQPCPTGLNAVGKFTVASDNDVEADNFVGALDEIRVWTINRKEAEIAATAKRPLLGTESSLAAYYRCDVSSRTTPDATPNLNALNLLGNVTGVPAGNFFVPALGVVTVTNVTSRSLAVETDILPYGSPTTAWVEWRDTQNPVTNRTTSDAIGSGTNFVRWNRAVSPLSAAVGVDLRVVASNAAGIIFSELKRVRTGGAVLTVHSEADSGVGTLRQLVADAVSGDTIRFLPRNESGMRIFLTSGPIVVDRDITFVGPGVGRLFLDGNGSQGVFRIVGGNVVMSDLTVTNGRGFGGAGIRIEPGARLTADRCRITGCYENAFSGGGGGGVLCLGRATLRDCTFDGNRTTTTGGGLSADGGDAVLLNCTFVGNTAQRGGAVAALNGDAGLQLVQCTLSANLGGQTAGAVYGISDRPSGASLLLQACTIVSNKAPDAGVVVEAGARLALRSSILSGNGAVNFRSAVTDVVDVANLSSDSSIGTWRTLDPRLLALSDNGGFTLTHALQADSPAIGRGENSTNAPAADQCHWPRRAGAPACGAVDYHRVYSAPLGSGNRWNVYVAIENSTDWQTAYRLATGSVFRGVSGHLATISSAAENDFVYRVGYGHSGWLGLTGLPVSDPVGTSWSWVTGEPYDFQMFEATPPSSALPTAAAIFPGKKWQALPRNLTVADGYVIEFDTQDSRPYRPSGRLAVFPEGLVEQLTGRDGFFDVAEWRDLPAASTVADAARAIEAGGGRGVHGLSPVNSFRDPDVTPATPGMRAFFSESPGMVDSNLVLLSRGVIRVPANQTGLWTFRVIGRGGFALRGGAETWVTELGDAFVDPSDPSVLTHYQVGDADFVGGGVAFMEEGDHRIEVLSAVGAAPAFLEVSAAYGARTNGLIVGEWQTLGSPGGLQPQGGVGLGAALNVKASGGGAVVASDARLDPFPFTVTAWVRLAGPVIGSAAILGKFDPQLGAGYYLSIEDGRAHGYFGVRSFGSALGTHLWANRSQSTFLADGRWHHLAMTVDSLSFGLYVDGHLQASGNGFNFLSAEPSVTPLTLGFVAEAGMIGQLDEVTLWDRALAEEEVVARMFEAVPANTAGLVGQWRFQENLGSHVRDESGHHLDGLLNAGASWQPSSAGETIPIRTTADAGPGSLRRALLSAAACTLSLETDDPIVVTDESLLLNECVRLRGGGVTGRSTLSQAPDSRGVSLLWSGANTVLDLENLRLRGGGGSNVSFGGALRCVGYVRARNTMFESNSVNVAELSLGGAVFVDVQGVARFSNCEFAGNYSWGDGGAVLNMGSAYFRQCNFFDNRASRGGAIGQLNTVDGVAGVVDLQGCSFWNNTADLVGGAVVVNDELSSRPEPMPPVLVAVNCTWYGNAATEGAAVAVLANTATLVHCTVASNRVLRGGAAIRTMSPVRLGNSIIAGTTDRIGGIVTDIAGPIHSLGGNLLQTTNAAVSIASAERPDRLGADPRFGTFGIHGGGTPVVPIAAESPAHDLGASILERRADSTDQRGQPRYRGFAPDAGAYEICYANPVVTQLGDSGVGSFRQAVSEATIGSTVTFAPNTHGGVILLSNGPVAIDGAIRILGPTAQRVTLDGGGTQRLLTVYRGLASISDLNFVRGVALLSDEPYSISGGAILSLGALELQRCYFASNAAQYNGGAVALVSRAASTPSRILDSTFTQNAVGTNGNGGAFFNDIGYGIGATATTLVQRCTFSGNGALPGALGGGIWGGGLVNFSGHLRVDQCTLTENTADRGGGLFNHRGVVRVRNTIIAGNGATQGGPDVDQSDIAADLGTALSDGHNLVGNRAGNLADRFVDGRLGDRVGDTALPLDAWLGQLRDNGGPTPTCALLAGSPAIDGGDASGAGSTDQRGYPRVSGAAMDIGAFEFADSLRLFAEVVAGRIYLRFVAAPSQSFAIVGRSELRTIETGWTTLGPAEEIAPGIYRFSEPVDSTGGNRFYRAVRP